MVKTLARSAARRRITSSAIRDLLDVAQRPDVISLAGGLPAPESFPVAALASAMADVLRHDPAGSLQYSTSQGDPELRQWIGEQRHATEADVVVTAGSQQALDLVARLLVDPGDAVALADPGYVGAIQAFRLAGADLLAVPADHDGLRVDVLGERLATGAWAVPRAVYVVSNFANPGGATLSLERRRALAALADHHGFVIVDDDPYGELRWAGTGPSPLAASSDRVVTLGSFSKVLSPGLRLGYAVGPPAIIEDLVLLKQAADLHTATFTQQAALRVVDDADAWTAHLDRIRRLYRDRAGALSAALTSRLGHRVEAGPVEGGMFVWARLPGVDTTALLPRAIDAGVAYVPGSAFAVAPGAHADALRLSFATVDAANLDEGVRRLATALRG
jgi:2-aminoadipate transaminase